MDLLQCGHRATRLPLQVPSGSAPGPGRSPKHQGQSFFMRLGYRKAAGRHRQLRAEVASLQKPQEHSKRITPSERTLEEVPRDAGRGENDAEQPPTEPPK